MDMDGWGSIIKIIAIVVIVIVVLFFGGIIGYVITKKWYWLIATGLAVIPIVMIFIKSRLEE